MFLFLNVSLFECYAPFSRKLLWKNHCRITLEEWNSFFAIDFELFLDIDYFRLHSIVEWVEVLIICKNQIQYSVSNKVFALNDLHSRYWYYGLVLLNSALSIFPAGGRCQKASKKTKEEQPSGLGQWLARVTTGPQPLPPLGNKTKHSSSVMWYSGSLIFFSLFFFWWTERRKFYFFPVRDSSSSQKVIFPPNWAVDTRRTFLRQSRQIWNCYQFLQDVVLQLCDSIGMHVMNVCCFVDASESDGNSVGR